MATRHPRLNVVLESPLYLALKRVARKEGVSLSLKARDLIREALETYEDLYWTKVAASRERSLRRKSALTHKQVWQ